VILQGWLLYLSFPWTMAAGGFAALVLSIYVALAAAVDKIESSCLIQIKQRVTSKQPPCLHVLAFDRPTSLQRLLGQLNRLDYGQDSGRVLLTIAIDAPVPSAPSDVRQRQKTSVQLATTFNFTHGQKVVLERPHNYGLAEQWVSSWQPDLDNREACVILEDDTFPSSFAWEWTRKALAAYSHDARIASLAWQRPTLIPAQNNWATMGTMPPDTQGKPFLYKLAATWGFIALRSPWMEFQNWFRKRYAPFRHQPIQFSGAEILPSQWHRNKPTQVWEFWFLKYMEEHHLYTLYGNMENKKTLCTNMREKGVNYDVGMEGGADFPTLDSHVPALDNFPELSSLTWYDWDARPTFPTVR
jgi:hypothetical protein